MPRYHWQAAVVVLLQSVALDAQTLVDTPAQAIDRVAAVIEATRTKQAALPTAANDSETLTRMAELEQAPRLVMSNLDLRKLDEPHKKAMWDGIWALVTPIDKDNQARLLAMVPAEGWFSSKTYGWQASISAFLIVQHSNADLWRRFLPKIEQMAKTGEADGGAYALMYDRLALSEGRPQRYGSQMTCTDGHWAVREPVEDRSVIDARRKEVGLDTLAENLKNFQNAC